MAAGRGIQKRLPSGDPATGQPPSKKAKTGSSPTPSSNFPPEFYDDLQRVQLTARALRELDRRNDLGKSTGLIVSDRSLRRLTRSYLRDIVVPSAQAGGPSLNDIRGYPNTAVVAAATASSSASSRRSGSTKGTSLSAKSKRSSAYDNNFEQHLINHNIYPLLYDFPDDRPPSQPANLDRVYEALKAPRCDMLPSTGTDSAFPIFQRNSKTKSEGTIMRNVIPIITGNTGIFNEGHLPFNNLDSITAMKTVNPTPDFFDGARRQALEETVLEDLASIIIPNRRAGVPVACNFSLEAKGPSGTSEVAERQALLNGAYGARMMHALQNYGLPEPAYDGNAYTFSATYVGWYLDLYAHHLSAPTGKEARPEYHTTHIKSCGLRHPQTWAEGITAFRNLRELAQDYRDSCIKTANERAQKPTRIEHETVAEEDPGVATSTTTEDQGEASSPEEYFECRLFAEPEDEQVGAEAAKVGLGIIHEFEHAGTSLASNVTPVAESKPSTSEHGSESVRARRSPPSPPTPRQRKKRWTISREVELDS